MSKVVAIVAISLFGLISISLDLSAHNDPVFYDYNARCGDNELVVDYEAHGGPDGRYSYTFNAFVRLPTGTEIKVGRVSAPGLPDGQRYIVAIPIAGPDGRYRDDPWPAGTEFFVRANSSGPDNQTPDFVCAAADTGAN